MESFIYVFAEPEISERDLRDKVDTLIGKIVTLLVRQARLHSKKEAIWAARGIVCTGYESVSFWGYADHVIFSGDQKLHVAICIEYKLVKEELAGDTRWFVISGAFLAQIMGDGRTQCESGYRLVSNWFQSDLSGKHIRHSEIRDMARKRGVLATLGRQKLQAKQGGAADHCRNGGELFVCWKQYSETKVGSKRQTSTSTPSN